MASAGWYPDPGGQQGMYRYWDGHAWSAVTSANPSAPPPNQGIGQPAEPSAGQSPSGGQGPYPQGQYGQVPYGQGQPPQAQQAQFGQGSRGSLSTQPTAYQNYQQVAQKKRSGLGWWLGAAAVLVVIIVVAVLVIRNLGGGGLNDPTAGGGGGSENPCPTTSQAPSANTEHPNDGRVHGGPVSYPMLGSPWSTPHPDNRVPFGSDVQVQDITIEANYQPRSNWVASVLVAELLAGDGFYTPRQGSEIVAKCVVGAFYGDNPVQRDDEESKAMKVDGHDAWYLKSHLSFDIQGLQAKGETMIIVIVSAGTSSGLYYASIPDNAKQYMPDADRALEGLKVDG